MNHILDFVCDEGGYSADNVFKICCVAAAKEIVVESIG
jgi:hypothetical protein